MLPEPFRRRASTPIEEALCDRNGPPLLCGEARWGSRTGSEHVL